MAPCGCRPAARSVITRLADARPVVARDVGYGLNVIRVAPLAPPWSEADAASINSWGHPDRSYEPLLLVRCLQRHPALAGRLRKLGESLYTSALLPPRSRTIAILRICALVGCEYEWGGQAAFWGPIAGVSDDECDALVTAGKDAQPISGGARRNGP